MIAWVTSAFASAPVVFPADEAWIALQCDGGAAWDPAADEADALRERDLVGGGDDAAGYLADDGDHLYLRMRLDADPLPSAGAWGFLLDADADPSTYEVQVLVDGADGVVSLSTNSGTAVPYDPSDPPDGAPAATYPFGPSVRAVSADTLFQGDPDGYLDAAVSWTALADLGVDAGSLYGVWLATGTAERLDGDSACYDPQAGQDVVLVGGGGHCATTDPRAGWLALVVLLGGAGLRARVAVVGGAGLRARVAVVGGAGLRARRPEGGPS